MLDARGTTSAPATSSAEVAGGGDALWPRADATGSSNEAEKASVSVA
jgi:hypothetical protein